MDKKSHPVSPKRNVLLLVVGAVVVATIIGLAVGLSGSDSSNNTEFYLAELRDAIQPLPDDEFDPTAYLGVWREAYASEGLQGSGLKCVTVTYGAVEGRDDVITVENLADNAPTAAGFGTQDPNSAASFQVNLFPAPVVEPQPFVESTYRIFALGPLNDDGLYSWAATTNTLLSSGALPLIYILVRDLTNFAANDEADVLQSLRDLGFYFEGEDSNANIPELAPVIKTDNEDCDSGCCDPIDKYGYVDPLWIEAGSVVRYQNVDDDGMVVDSLEAYVVYPSDVGAAVDNSAASAVILVPGSQGFNAGRIREHADAFATRGYAAVVPKVLNNGAGIVGYGCSGDGIPCSFTVDFDTLESYEQWIESHPFDGYLDSKIQVLLDNLPQSNLHAVGFCWGMYFATHLAIVGGDRVKSLVSPHPSLEVAERHGEDPIALATQVTQPALLLPGCDGLCDTNDPATPQCPVFCRPDNPELYNPVYGSVVQALQGANPDSEAIQFYRMLHGWTLYGDFNNDSSGAIRVDTESTMGEICDWVDLHDTGGSFLNELRDAVQPLPDDEFDPAAYLGGMKQVHAQ